MCIRDRLISSNIPNKPTENISNILNNTKSLEDTVTTEKAKSETGTRILFSGESDSSFTEETFHSIQIENEDLNYNEKTKITNDSTNPSLKRKTSNDIPTKVAKIWPEIHEKSSTIPLHRAPKSKKTSSVTQQANKITSYFGTH